MKTIKKLSFLAIIICIFSLIPVFSVSAKDCAQYRDSSAQNTDYDKCMQKEGNYDSTESSGPSSFKGRDKKDCPYFLGLTSWDCGVEISDQDSLVSGIGKIAANVLIDIGVIAAYLILGYVIYGGYLYTFSGGDPNKTAAGKKTLTQAFIGLAIVMSANLILSTIRFVLLGSDGSLAGCATSECRDLDTLVTDTIQWFIAIAGVISAIFIVYGGIMYTTSSGNPSKLQKAKL